MKQIIALTLLALAFAAPTQAAAECFVAYKAKKSPPLELHFGILSLSGSCPSASAASGEVAGRISGDGWTLLNVVSVSETAPSATERANAGSYYLRY